MKQFVLIGAVLFQLLVLSIAQRVAPGVPPQHYQNPPPQQPHGGNPQYQQAQHPPQHQQQQHHQQQHQQQHVQHQQQYQQVPVNQQPPVHQQQQQQQHQQQPPVQHQGGHGHGHGPPHQQNQVLGANIQQEKDHIAEHMEVPIDTSKMSEQELQFHYFKMHDADNNNKLDGCELIKSLIHWHEQGSKEVPNPEVPHVEEKVFADQELVSLIDPILQMDDYNRDGFIDYPEFVHAQQKAAANSQQQQPAGEHQPQQQQQHQQQPPHP